MKRKLILLIPSILLFGFTTAQSLERSVIGSAGGFSSAGNVQISWTAGETVVNTASAGSVILTQGFQQPEQTSNHVISVDLQQKISVFPNPSSGIFNISLVTDQFGVRNFTADIYDGAGKHARHIGNLDLTSAPGRIDLSSLPAGIYTLKLNSSDQVSATFRLTVIN